MRALTRIDTPRQGQGDRCYGLSKNAALARTANALTPSLRFHFVGNSVATGLSIVFGQSFLVPEVFHGSEDGLDLGQELAVEGLGRPPGPVADVGRVGAA